MRTWNGHWEKAVVPILFVPCSTPWEPSPTDCIILTCLLAVSWAFQRKVLAGDWGQEREKSMCFFPVFSPTHVPATWPLVQGASQHLPLLPPPLVPLDLRR